MNRAERSIPFPDRPGGAVRLLAARSSQQLRAPLVPAADRRVALHDAADGGASQSPPRAGNILVIIFIF